MLRHHSDAIPVCQRLVQERPADETGWGLLGRAYLGTGEWEQAVAAYDQSLNLRQDPLIAAEAAGALMELDRYREAETVLRQALSHADSTSLRAQLAHVLTEQGRHRDAEQLLRDVLSREPRDAAARNVLPVILADSNRVAEALSIANGLVVDFPSDAGAHAVLGWVSLRAGRVPDALQAYEVALRIQPGEIAFMAGHASALKRGGRTMEADAIVRAITARDPTYFARHREWSDLVDR